MQELTAIFFHNAKKMAYCLRFTFERRVCCGWWDCCALRGKSSLERILGNDEGGNNLTIGHKVF